MGKLLRIKQSLPCSFCLLLLTGCWSYRDIDEDSIEMARAFDIANEESIEQESDETDAGYPGKNLITLTHQIILPESMTAEGSPPEKPYHNISHTGNSIHELIRKKAFEGKAMTTVHLKVIVIGEDIGRKVSIENLLNQTIHDETTRRSVLLLFAKGRASETLNTQASEEIPAEQLLQTSKNQFYSTGILPAITIGDASSKMANNVSFLLQGVVSKNGNVEFSGGAVIEGKTKKLVGFLTEQEIEGINWLTGNGQGGLLKTFDEKNKQPIVYEILSLKSQIKPLVKENKISFNVEIESEGRITEDWLYSGDAMQDQHFQKEIEKSLDKKVRELTKEVVNTIQKEYKTDVAGFGDVLSIKYPRVWEKVKKDWDNQFSDIPININVKINITRSM